MPENPCGRISLNYMKDYMNVKVTKIASTFAVTWLKPTLELLKEGNTYNKTHLTESTITKILH